jgi:simple sugar transport system ATP-binding protein/ribose transport system ATP-binding protein
LSRWSWISRKRELAAVTEQVAKVGVKAASLTQSARMLSGGNQQKILFARTLMCTPKVLICDEPTRGVDVGSKRAIYDLLVAKAQEGMGIVVVSSELEEILGLAHRVVVMRHGQITASLDGDNVNEQAILVAAFADAPSA